MCIPISKEISENICNLQLISKNQKTRSPRAPVHTCHSPSAELKLPLSMRLGFSRVCESPCSVIAHQGAQRPVSICCYTCATLFVTLRIRGQSPCGGDTCHRCLIHKQRMLEQHNLRSFYEANWTILPAYITSLASPVLEFGGLLELSRAGQVSELMVKGLLELRRGWGDPLSQFSWI